MRFSRVGRRRTLAGLDITPMIDVVFQLVLFFMVTTNFVTSAEGIQVDLPRASADLVMSTTDDVQLWLDRDGSVFVGDSPVDLDGLKRVLRAAAEKDPSTLIVVKADASVSHGRVVTVMDLARSFQLTRIAIATDPEGKAAGGVEGGDPR